MARQAIRARRSVRTVLAGGLGAAVLVLTVGVAPALAASEPPVWVPISFAEPTHLQPGSPRNAAQEWSVDATGGTYSITIKTSECGEAASSGPIAYNATAEELEKALDEISCEFGSSESGFVTGGPGVPGGPGYRIEYSGQYLGTRSNTTLPTFHTENLSAGATAKAENTAEAEREGTVLVSATDVGGTTDGGEVTIEDTLPKGLTATEIRGADAYLSNYVTDGEGSTEMKCSPHPATEPLVCTIEGAEIISGDTLVLAIHVKVTESPGADEVNTATVSGGGAEPASVSNPVAISSTPAGYGLSPGDVLAGFSTDQAGAHGNATTGFVLNTKGLGEVAEPEKDIRVDLPPGAVGNATQLPKCTIAKVLEIYENPLACPASSMVGITTIYISATPESPPLGITTPIYTITPAPGEPVAFAFIAATVPVRLDTSLLSTGNYGVRVTAPSLSEAGQTFATWITLWGVPADYNGPSANPNVKRVSFFGIGRPFGGPEPGEQRQPFLTNPQECGKPLDVIFSTDSWLKAGVFLEEATTMPGLIGCEALKLQPSFTMLPDTLEAGAPAGYTLDLTVPQNNEADALVTPTVKDVKLALPVGAVVSPSVAWGLKACSAAQFGLHSGVLAECPREAQVGEIEIESQDLPETLRGDVYLASPQCSHDAEGQELCTPENAENGEMVRLYVQAVSQGESRIIVKLEGRASINQATGQITATFEESPPLPFDKFVLKLGGGPRATLANQRQCGPATTTMDLTPWSTPFTEDANPFSTFIINKNCFSPTFNPTVTPGTTSIQSGEYSPFTLIFGRSDDEGVLAGLQETLPPGLLGKIKGVTLCPEPGASEGNCPGNSLVGTVQALTGPGADPFLVTNGKVYLTGGYKGAPFGLSIVVPAVAGPYTLEGTNGKGDVVVRAAINVNKENAQLTVTADPLPTELDGVPLQIKVLDVTINRPEFTFNPTSCEKMAISTIFTSQEGATAIEQTPFQVTNCVGLGFNPRFEATTSGQTSRTDGASLDARLIYPLGKKLANVKNVKVELPKQLPSRLTTLQQACTDHVFAENPEACPAASRIGQARANTPILPNELEGWAYFVSHGGAAFPNLVIVLQDRPDGVRVDLVGETFISKAGITSTTFGTVPDVPISEFELYLPEGPNSALAANGDLCKTVLRMPTEFHGQNGGVLKQSTPVGVTGCPTKAAKAKKARRARRARAAAAHHQNKYKKKDAKKARRASRHAGNRRGK